jgi:hypothetical protein
MYWTGKSWGFTLSCISYGEIVDGEMTALASAGSGRAIVDAVHMPAPKARMAVAATIRAIFNMMNLHATFGSQPMFVLASLLPIWIARCDAVHRFRFRNFWAVIMS